MPPVVHIDISVPGHNDIVVAHEADRLQRKYQAQDLRNAINEAFRIAAATPGQYKDKLTDHGIAERGHVIYEFRGQIAEITPEKDFGFLLTKEGGLLYFHRNSLLSGDFDGLERGDEVSYVKPVTPDRLLPKCGSPRNSALPLFAEPAERQFFSEGAVAFEMPFAAHGVTPAPATSEYRSTQVRPRVVRAPFPELCRAETARNVVGPADIGQVPAFGKGTENIDIAVHVSSRRAR